MRIETARKLAFRLDMAETLMRQIKERTIGMERGSNSLGRLNEVLFDELERLNDVDLGDEDAVRREIERSRAIEGVSKNIIENGKTILTATRMRAEFGMDTKVPTLLEG